MQFEGIKINISVNSLKYGFYYSFNNNATFSDLLEYFSFLVPDLNICTCYQFVASKNNKCIEENYFNIPHQSKVEEYKNFLNNIILEKKEDICKHDKSNILFESKKDIINNYEKIISQNNKEIDKYKKENSSLKEELSKIKFLSQPNNEKLKGFYDIIVHIDSVKDINKGWKIEMNENGKKNYEEFKSENILKIGVIGNANKGKSHLLSKISKINLPSGMTIKTEGLSIKYPEIELKNKRKIALLDSAGLETPVLISDINSRKNESNELFKEKSREKLITELFLQNYIVNNSDILLVVVDCLSYSEQKLLLKIKKEIEISYKKSQVFVIHNLKNYTSINQVNDYIHNILLKSATFELVEANDLRTDKERTGIYFFEKPKKRNGQIIYHLIYANEDSEAGKYYNPFTLKFIEQYYNYMNNLGNYDVIQTIKERFIEKYEEIVEKGEKINMNSFENSNPNLIKLKNEKKIILKQCFINELGFSNLKSNGFEPKFNLFQEEDKIIVRVEVPGHCEIQSEIEDCECYNIIKLTGKKLKDKKPQKIEDNIINFREYGDFSLEIPVSKNYIFTRDNPAFKKIDGLLFFEYKINIKNGCPQNYIDYY